MRTITQRAALGPIPGGAILICVAIFYAYLIGLMVFTPTLRGTGTEIIGRSRLLRRLVHPRTRLVGFKQKRQGAMDLGGAGLAPEED